MAYTDADLLRIVGDERKRSIGFGDGADSGDLTDSRTRALEYQRGEMSDVPAAEGRSSVVDTAIADAVSTVLPDVIEVFFGGDDVLSFIPEDEQDEDRAEEESEAVKYIVFTLNQALLAFTTAFQDAFLGRLGLFHWWWEDSPRETVREGLMPVSAMMLQMELAQTRPWAEVETEQRDDGTVCITVTELRGKICFRAVPPEDFSVAPDTVELSQASYCVMRERPRVQDLIARGIDAAKARALPRYVYMGDAVSQSRDNAGESRMSESDAPDDLRQVEVRAHYLRIDKDGDGDPEIYRLLTNADETELLDEEEVSHIPFGPLTPYVVSHRFYGQSLADKLFELQKIKTVLWRAGLDNIYFSLNQRMEVSDAGANEYTIADLLRNQPGVPVRSKNGEAVRPITAGGLNVDTFAALEYASTVAEQRTGVVRNAQGLNPDTLHDTAAGAQSLISAAQKRTRFIARLFAEMGVKDLALGVRRLMRENYDPRRYAPNQMRRGARDWKSYDPTQWAEDREVTVHVGVGGSGKEAEIMAANQGLQITKEIITLQGGVHGPFVDAPNVHNRLKKWSQANGERNADLYWSDPAKAGPPPPPKPDPKMVEAQQKMQLAQQQAQADLQLQQAKDQASAQQQAEQGQRDHELALMRLDQEMTLKREQIAAELQLKREQLTAELELKRELGFAQAQSAHEQGMYKASVSTSEVEPGGEPG